ncbi:MULTISPECIES: glycosyltransferase [Pseudanabaena]|uniref:Glycosyl transferase family 2 n=2 Tax=Pseudanabaena TaxID=1152 RepID=L8N1V1_9CYAN|nr:MULTISPECIES: glycosyltransferase [Pseudanabaena]ELS33064.1 glycosyl transferase family 2 [Pseudanabaena biceps PCC 7429]MDG3494714.1 glycosyltransferase [Pseudanabaena catenata USMAC16]
MKVLIADFDLFSKIGGGQTFYRNLISKNPNIDFYYFRISEQASDCQLTNAHPIDFQESYHISDYLGFQDLTPPQWIYGAFIKANNIASSVSGRRFDVVDIPDYEQMGTMLRPAFKHHNVDVERIVLSMHGNISTSQRFDWFNGGNTNQALVLQEKLQYDVVDIRYGISKTYLEEWKDSSDLLSHYLNPLSVISLPKPQCAKPSAKKPNLNFVGRTEKRKGPDTFINIAWWLPRAAYNQASIIGSDSFDSGGEASSRFFLDKMVSNRMKSEISLLSAMSYEELEQKVFSTRSLTILPSKYDTLNLTAIESLFSGCPTAIGSGAGVIRFLKENFANVSFVTIDVNNIYSSIPHIYSVLKDYDDYRYQLLESLSRVSLELIESTLTEIYSSEPSYEDSVRVKMERWYSLLMRKKENSGSAISYLKKSSPILKQAFKSIKPLIKNPKKFIKNKLLSTLSKNKYEEFRILDQGLKSLSLFDKYRNVFLLNEGSSDELTKKLKLCWEISSECRFDRVRVWREIARLEGIRGNDVVSATYYIRAMRLLGSDRFGDLAEVIPTLNNNGFAREALVAEAMYGKPLVSNEMAKSILDKALSENKTNSKWEYEFIDDRRQASFYKVSIIVSLYNAAKKLPLFLQTIKYQTLIQVGVVEVILIDSGSPSDEYGAFVKAIEGLDIPIVFARSANRETIQSAWNRGIALSRSSYLTFLGVDETIVPECLEILAAELDKDKTLDWVQANSLVTNVDTQGRWVSDIMLYDRRDYKQDLVYLETCYLSWVGALYRRSIHDRFGYYDASFNAAGDTEFKGRVLPFIKTKVIPKTLGVFLNYPDERTTQHPRAEIEDLRAWYLHRTLSGIEYAFANRDHHEAEQLFYNCLRYRKSFCGHWSTDIEYAYNLGCFIQKHNPFSESAIIKYLPRIKELLSSYRSLDLISKISKTSTVAQIFSAKQSIKSIEEIYRTQINPTVEPVFQIFNDNRYEQHSFLWFTDISSSA